MPLTLDARDATGMWVLECFKVEKSYSIETLGLWQQNLFNVNDSFCLNDIKNKFWEN